MFNSALAARRGKPRLPSTKRRAVQGEINTDRACIYQGLTDTPCSSSMTFSDPFSREGVLDPVCSNHLEYHENTASYIHSLARMFGWVPNHPNFNRIDEDWRKTQVVNPQSQSMTEQQKKNDALLREQTGTEEYRQIWNKPSHPKFIRRIRRRNQQGTESQSGGGISINDTDFTE